MYDYLHDGETAATEFFDAYTETVKATVPADRLLVFDVRQGWGPLCQFLGVPVPDEPFPRVNDSDHKKVTIQRAQMLNVAVKVGLPILLAGFVYFFLVCFWS